MFPVGIAVQSTLKGYPAESVLKPGDVIVSINGEKIVTFDDLSRVLSRHKPGDRIVIEAIRGGRSIELQLTLAENPYNSSRGFIGAYFVQAVNNIVLYNILWWSIVATSSVAIINMLPIYPLDGGRDLEALLRRFFGDSRSTKAILYFASAYFALVLILNMVFSFSMFGIRPFP